MAWTPNELEDYVSVHRETIALLTELREHGFHYKTLHHFEFSPSATEPHWSGLDEDTGFILLHSHCEPGAVAHEMGHGFHECLRRDFSLPNQFGDDYAEAIRWFTEQRIGPSDWCRRFTMGTRWRAVLDACQFDWLTFINRLKTGQYYPRQ